MPARPGRRCGLRKPDVSDAQQLALTLAGAVVGSSALTAFVTLYFTRRKTDAETRSIHADALTKHAAAHKTDSDANRTDAETMQIYVAELRTSIAQWKLAMSDWGECERGKREAEAERDRLGALAESYRFQVEKLQEVETDLRGQVKDLLRAKKA